MNYLDSLSENILFIEFDFVCFG